MSITFRFSLFILKLAKLRLLIIIRYFCYHKSVNINQFNSQFCRTQNKEWNKLIKFVNSLLSISISIINVVMPIHFFERQSKYQKFILKKKLLLRSCIFKNANTFSHNLYSSEFNCPFQMRLESEWESGSESAFHSSSPSSSSSYWSSAPDVSSPEPLSSRSTYKSFSSSSSYSICSPNLRSSPAPNHVVVQSHLGSYSLSSSSSLHQT